MRWAPPPQPMASSGQGGTWYEISPSLNISFPTVPFTKGESPAVPWPHPERVPSPWHLQHHHQQRQQLQRQQQVGLGRRGVQPVPERRHHEPEREDRGKLSERAGQQGQDCQPGKYKHYLAGSVGFGFLNAFNAQYFVNYVNYAASDVTLITWMVFDLATFFYSAIACVVTQLNINLQVKEKINVCD